MADFTGQLNSNEIYASLWNMVISIQTFTDNVALDSSLVDNARVDGSLFGDTKLYISTDVLRSQDWEGDEEAKNLLEIHRAKDPKVQALQLNKTRMIALTVDYYLSKRAFLDEGSFSQYTTALITWINDTKRIYDYTLYNAFIGTNETDLNGQSIVFNDISIAKPTTAAAANLEAQNLAYEMSTLIRNLCDVTRSYSDYGFLRAYSKDKIKVIWNQRYLDRIRTIDLPTIYHNEFMDSLFSKYSLPAKYFGKVNSGSTSGDGSTIRFLNETYYESDKSDYFGGEIVPSGKASDETYTEDDSIIAKVIVGDLPPLMSSFEVGTSFYNARSLTENKYFIWGFNTLEHLKNYPYITIRAKK